MSKTNLRIGDDEVRDERTLDAQPLGHAARVATDLLHERREVLLHIGNLLVAQTVAHFAHGAPNASSRIPAAEQKYRHQTPYGAELLYLNARKSLGTFLKKSINF